MTSYIDNSAAPVPADPRAPAFPPAPFFTAAPAGLLALWSLPWTMFQFWANSWSSLLPKSEPETDGGSSGDQLPVPDPLQKAKDSELFA